MSLFPEARTENTQHDRAAKQTYSGMASWACSPDKTCRQCTHFYHKEGKGKEFHSVTGKYGGRLKDGRCAKYRMMTGTEGAKFSPHAKACRYFGQNPTPPKRSLNDFRGD